MTAISIEEEIGTRYRFRPRTVPGKTAIERQIAATDELSDRRPTANG
jgi:hypothetical protein